MSDRVEALRGWRDDWAGLRVAILGLDAAGFSVADTLTELGVTTTVFAGRAEQNLALMERADLLAVIGAGLWQPESGGGLGDSFAIDALVRFGPELVIVTSEFLPNHPLVRWAESRLIPLWGEIELAWRLRDKTARPDEQGKLRPAEWFTVTGATGTAETIQLATAMMSAAGHRVIACGDSNALVLDAIRDPGGFDALVVSFSPFQRQLSSSVSAHTSVCLNVAVDDTRFGGDSTTDQHLDYADSSSAGGGIYANTKIACLFNRDVIATRSMVEEADVVEGCRAIGFGLGVPGPSDFGVVSEYLLDRAFLADRYTGALEIESMQQLEKVGLDAPHLVTVVLAASALARSFDVSIEQIRSTITSFHEVGDRLKTIACRSGVSWIDNSGATNSWAQGAAIASFESIVWIVDGVSADGTDLALTIKTIGPRLRAAVMIGSGGVKLRAFFARHAPLLPVLEVESADTDEVMHEAVRLAAAVAHAGDVVLLAPSSASINGSLDRVDCGRRFAAAVWDMLGDDSHDGKTPRSGSTKDE